LLQFLDPSILPRHEPLQEGQSSSTPLHLLADLLDPTDYLTHVNQLILAEQLMKHGANVNAVSFPHGETPLHSACYADVKLLLVEGADPNAQSHLWKTTKRLDFKA
jgi:ankyrin repeat protein